MNTESSFKKDGIAIVEEIVSHDVVDPPFNASPRTSMTDSSETLPAVSFKKYISSEWPSQQSIIESNTLHYVRIQKEAEAWKQQEQLTNIRTPNEHDVLCGRGNFVNNRRGNQYYRSLVRKYFPHYDASPKREKRRYALLIYRDIRMLDPPGRFLRKDTISKLWHDVGEKKALDKTRQALREGAPDTKRNDAIESLARFCVCKTKNGSLGGKTDTPPCEEDHLSIMNCTGCEVNTKADHVNISDRIDPQTGCFQKRKCSQKRKHSSAESHHIHEHPQQNNQSLYTPLDAHNQYEQSNNFSYGSPHVNKQCQHEIARESSRAQQEYRLSNRPVLQPPHTRQFGKNNNSSYGLSHAHQQDQQRFDQLLSNQHFQHSNMLLTKSHNAEQQDQQNSQSLFEYLNAQHERKQTCQSDFESQQHRQSDQSSFRIPNCHLQNIQSSDSSSFINEVISKISKATGVPHDDNLIKAILEVTVSANGEVVGNGSSASSAALNIAAAKGVGTSEVSTKIIGAKISASLSEVLGIDNSVPNPSSLNGSNANDKYELPPVSFTVPKNVTNIETAASKHDVNINAKETTFNITALNAQYNCMQNRTDTAANGHTTNDVATNITATNKVAIPGDYLDNKHVPEIAPRANMRKILVNAITPGNDKSKEVFPDEPIVNAAQSDKRTRAHDNVIESNKKSMTYSAQQPCIKEELVAALLSMSHSGDQITRDANFDGDCGSVGNSIDKTTYQTCTTSTLNDSLRETYHSSAIRSLPSLENIIQCDKCRVASTSSIPPSNLSNLRHTPEGDPTCGTSMLAGVHLKSCLKKQPRTSSTIVKTGDEKSKVNDSCSNEQHDFFPDWTERICVAEKKWGIQHDNTKPYYQRIEKIEKKKLEYMKALHCSNVSSQEVKAKELLTSDDSFSKIYLEKVEDEEKKWGVSAPEGFNVVERIEMVEDVVSSYNRRLQRCL